MSTLSDFLKRNTVKAGGTLPLIHTTRSYHLKELVSQNKLLATECSVFAPDKLSYFFVGRPAYKYQSTDAEAQHWELPCCFIFDFSVVTGIKRVYPFDSGAFNSNLYPPYINQIPLDHYDANDAPDAPSKIIGAFFGDVKSYFALAPKSEHSFNAEFSPESSTPSSKRYTDCPRKRRQHHLMIAALRSKCRALTIWT